MCWLCHAAASIFFWPVVLRAPCLEALSTAGSSLLKALEEMPLGHGYLGLAQRKQLLLLPTAHVSTGTPQGWFGSGLKEQSMNSTGTSVLWCPLGFWLCSL